MKRIYMFMAAVLLTLAACEKTYVDTEEPVSAPYDVGVRALVLNEGAWGGNNASLSYYEEGKIVNTWFSTVNGRGLGDVAQDLVVYGTKAYVSVWGSSSLEAVDTATGVAVHADLDSLYPRYIAAAGGKLYITCYNPHCVVRVDTSTLQVEARCMLGKYNPEGIAALGGRLYVASDNIADSRGDYTYDSLLYVIDQTTFSVVDSVVVGVNPQKVIVVDDNHLVVNHWGQWDMTTLSTIGEGSSIVDVSDLSVRRTGCLMSNMTVCNGTIYAYAQNYAADGSTVANYFTMNPVTLNVTPILVGCGIDNPYAIAVERTTGHIYVASDGGHVADGDLYCFGNDGKLLGRVSVGMLPSKVVFL